MTFPEDFGWGTAIASASPHGPSPSSDLAAWQAKTSDQPGPRGIWADQSPSDDFALLASNGLRQLRLTLDWSALEPSQGSYDSAAIEDLRLLLSDARQAGLQVWGCLHDLELPGWFSVDERGYRDPRTRRYYWARHVEFIAETFADLVHGWVPIAEPGWFALRGWLDGTAPPGKTDDAEGFAAMLEATQIAGVEAALRLRQGGQPVASAQWAVPIYPHRVAPGAPADAQTEAMASIVDETLTGSFIRLIEEESMAVPGRPAVQVPNARGAYDLIGLTYRHASTVRADGQLFPSPSLSADYSAAWAEGLDASLHRFAEAFAQRPLVLAGVASPVTNEDDHARFVRDMAAVVDEACAGGIDLRGAWLTRPFDTSGATGDAPGLFDASRQAEPTASLLRSIVEGGEVPSL